MLMRMLRTRRSACRAGGWALNVLGSVKLKQLWPGLLEMIPADILAFFGKFLAYESSIP